MQAPRDAQYALDITVSAAARARSRRPPSRRSASRPKLPWAQLDAIERGESQPPTGRMTRPRLATGARLQYDEVREEHMLLIPEGAVRLNPTAAEVLELCDGERSLDDIVGALGARYEGADLREDVQELIDALAQQGLVVDAAA